MASSSLSRVSHCASSSCLMRSSSCCETWPAPAGNPAGVSWRILGEFNIEGACRGCRMEASVRIVDGFVPRRPGREIQPRLRGIPGVPAARGGGRRALKPLLDLLKAALHVGGLGFGLRGHVFRQQGLGGITATTAVRIRGAARVKVRVRVTVTVRVMVRVRGWGWG